VGLKARQRVKPPPLVLGYHCLGQVAKEHDPSRLAVAPARFEAQVRSLLDRGYELVTVSQFVERLHDLGPPRGVCALTFDDGSVDNATLLPDLLARLRVPATIFVCPGLLGRPHPFLSPEAGVRLMSAEELQALSRVRGVEIGSHTAEHADLGSATAEEAYRELASSKQMIEGLLGSAVTSFAYPFGRYSPACPAAAKRAGYTCAVTGEGRGGWTPYELRREGIAAWDGRVTFGLKSRGLGHAFLRSPLGRKVLAWRRAARPPRQQANAERRSPPG
jgi:peptidoglycan/xylan/chitin deacetylase (PgdA/CDA1 family)